MPRWSVVIPVKPALLGKSRLRHPAAVAAAIALDTVAAAVATVVDGERVRVIVVTADDAIAVEAEALGAEVVREDAPAGLRAAIERGLAQATGNRAVLLGDLPALRPPDLVAALTAAATEPRAFVSDAEGTGTTLVTARSGEVLLHHFGADSARRHRDAGLVELAVPAGSTLRRDVDLPEHLDALAADGTGADGTLLGERTRAALRR